MSVSYVLQNRDEVWFQVYGRLVGSEKKSKVMSKYLERIEKNAPRPWLKANEGLVSSVTSGMKNLIDLREMIDSIALVPK